MVQHDDEPSAGGESTRAEARLTRNGGVTYLHLPATDARQSAAFYEHVFGWAVERRDADHASFTDAAGHMTGAWVTGLAVAREPGPMLYIYVDAIEDALQRIVERGGAVAREPYAEGTLRIARFRDPAGNVLGLWQETQR